LFAVIPADGLSGSDLLPLFHTIKMVYHEGSASVKVGETHEMPAVKRVPAKTNVNIKR
jgi:hypothetical protein